jgi:hypothetical protein
VSAALQQLAAVGIQIFLETEVFGFKCTVQLPTLRLPMPANGELCYASKAHTATHSSAGTASRWSLHLSFQRVCQPCGHLSGQCCEVRGNLISGNERDTAAARRRRRRSSLSSQASSTLSSAPSTALSVGTVDDAVLTLRQRLSDPACGAASSSTALPGSVAAGREPLDGAAAGAVAMPPAGMTVADMLRASGEEMDDPCLLRCVRISITCREAACLDA